ncbi:hypothetical protein BJV74DRAFT_797433 [Russula compacta]|nr:hypothetical protein BJV74DRAFT_797433 [Russula compacta]
MPALNPIGMGPSQRRDTEVELHSHAHKARKKKCNPMVKDDGEKTQHVPMRKRYMRTGPDADWWENDGEQRRTSVLRRTTWTSAKRARRRQGKREEVKADIRYANVVTTSNGLLPTQLPFPQCFLRPASEMLTLGLNQGHRQSSENYVTIPDFRYDLLQLEISSHLRQSFRGLQEEDKQRSPFTSPTFQTRILRFPRYHPRHTPRTDPGPYQSGDDRRTKWLNPTVNVLYNFSAVIGGGISLVRARRFLVQDMIFIVTKVYSPAGVIFTGIGILLSAAAAVSASQDTLTNAFDRIENFFSRLEIYIKVRATAGMTEIIVKIMVEVLSILGIATKEIKQSRATYGCSEKYLKKLLGMNDMEDALGRLDRLTEEEARMAAAQGLEATHEVDDKVQAVDDKVQDVGQKVQGVDHRIKDLDDKIDKGTEGILTHIGNQNRSSFPVETESL